MLNEKNKEIIANQNLDIIKSDALNKKKEELLKTNVALSEELKKLEETAAKEGAMEAEVRNSLITPGCS